ncbi:MAG: DUF5615 family PIN-like protein, partial [Anaerolineales bacterium]
MSVSWWPPNHELVANNQNISPRLVERLADLYPGSVHVFRIGMGEALDIEVWQYAYNNDCMIGTKDADFGELGLIKGFPPKIIW